MTTASTTTPQPPERTPFERATDLLVPLVRAECARLRCTDSLVRDRHELVTDDHGLLENLRDYEFSLNLNKELSQVALRRHGDEPSTLVDLKIVVRVWSVRSRVYVDIKRDRS